MEKARARLPLRLSLLEGWRINHQKARRLYPKTQAWLAHVALGVSLARHQ